MNNIIIGKLTNPHVAVVDRHESWPDPLTFLKGKKKRLKPIHIDMSFLTFSLHINQNHSTT